MATSSSSSASASLYSLPSHPGSKTDHRSQASHFNYENWPSLSFLEDLEEEDVEVTKASAFDPVVGGRNQSTRSSSSRSSGSTGFYEAVEMSPTNSLSPHAFVSFAFFKHGEIEIYQKSIFYPKIRFFKISIFTKFTSSKSQFYKIHIFNTSFFTKFTFLKSHFSQNSHF